MAEFVIFVEKVELFDEGVNEKACEDEMRWFDIVQKGLGIMVELQSWVIVCVGTTGNKAIFVWDVHGNPKVNFIRKWVVWEILQMVIVVQDKGPMLGALLVKHSDGVVGGDDQGGSAKG